ncbi:hypothetical protein [Larkinella humicola]|uniref:Phage tail protein n=1 Tax=Larkinella humicola TaxID=2607654 RepID=A0A5N1JP46_9BACT|nr:hypothetical protein [Larkinella humicola]KAA9357237.1 hypothetical protein F0P93_05735 [Larkinella humicola]
MAARTDENVAGDEIYLYAKVGSTFIKWGCMDSFSFKSSIESFEVNCRAFSGKKPSGKAASWTISTGGFNRIFNPAAEALNISVKKAYEWHAGKTIIEIQFGTEFEGDPIWLGKAFITEFELNGNQGEASKYSLTLEGSEPITVDTVDA